ncbi:hypothetical protein ACQ4PT_014931 [Festuca glaucescens]
MEGLGFREVVEAQIGGIVDMEDDVYLEFDEEEEVKKDPDEPTTWQLMARYMANFKPNTKAMFNRFADEVWHLRTGIRYSEKGKNYYMITLFSKGDYDFVKRGGPWIFNQNALIVKDFDDAAQPSDIKFDAVPVWVRIYDVPFGKQDEVWGKRYGNGLGKALEVDVPSSKQDKHEFLRVRVNLPCDRRLQTQITTGVKGKPREIKVFKLKYERVPYYCSHCGFMGHKKDECEKRWLGVPSLDYDAHELRCSPYKKFVHRTHFVPPAGQPSAHRGLSFSSFGSAESRKPFDQGQPYGMRRHSITHEHVNSRSGSVDNEMPPLIDDITPVAADALGNGADRDGPEGEVALVSKEEELKLAAQVDAMQMEPSQGAQPAATPQGRDASHPILQFPEEDAHIPEAKSNRHVHVQMTARLYAAYAADVGYRVRQEVKETLHVTQENFETKYIGLPTPDGRMSSGKFQSLQAKLAKCLVEWDDNHKSQAAKEVLIKAIAQSILVYVMSVFKLPFGLCDELTRMIRRDMRLFNQALLTRQAWKLIQYPNTLCAQILKAKYFPNGSLIDTVFTGNGSSTWHAIEHGLQLLMQGVIWRVGNGAQIRAWRDPWIPRDSGYLPRMM